MISATRRTVAGMTASPAWFAPSSSHLAVVAWTSLFDANVKINTPITSDRYKLLQHEAARKVSGEKILKSGAQKSLPTPDD